MEQIIIIGPKEEIYHMDFIKNLIASQAINVLIIDPKEQPNYEEIVEKANDKFITLNCQEPEKLRKEIEKFSKTLEQKPQLILDPKPLIDETPWYDRFLKKWRKDNHRWNKKQFTKKTKRIH